MSPVDTESFVRRNAIVYRCLTPSPAQALLFGNGAMGGSAHTPEDSLHLLISRSDIWNEKGGQGSIAAIRLRGLPGMFAQAKTIRQECNLAEASIRIEADDVKVTINCLRGRDVIVVDVEGPQRFVVPPLGGIRPGPLKGGTTNAESALSATIENWHEGDETTATETVHVNRTSYFAEANARVKVDAAALGLDDPLLGRAWGLFLDHSQPNRILIATACSMAGTEVVRQTGRALLAAARTHADAWLAEHRRWWADFWSRSHIALESGTGDAEYEERLWYANLYYLACAHGGEFPARFNGGPFLLDQDHREWDGGYWFQNMRQVYWPLLAAGHWEFMARFFQMYFDALPFVRAQTRAIFGLDAPAYRETQTFWGLSLETDLLKSQFPQPIHHNFSNNLEVCLLMDWYWRAAGDETFLREKFYPFLKQIIGFYQQYAKKEADGRYHLAPANAIEVWPDARDPMPDIAGLRYLLPRLIEWGQRFRDDATTIAGWREFLENLAPIPVGYWTITRGKVDAGVHVEEWHTASQLDPNGMFLPAAGSTHEKMLRRNMENAEIYLVFPWGLLGMDSPTEERRRFEVTWHHRTWKLVNNGWAQDVPQLARMGWAELAKTTSLEHASYNQRFPNGGFISPGGPHFHGLLTAHPYLDAAGVHVTGLNEMLLQSYDGIIRICPATTVEWSGRFKLHALDGFLVEAAFDHGQPVAARITASRDARLRVRWRGELVERDMKAGETQEFGPWIVRVWDDDRVEMVYPGYKIRPPLVAHASGHWHDERKGHGQIGLAEDGLFPATRSG